jgi:hypothetical protein
VSNDKKLSRLSPHELLSLHESVEHELFQRGIVRSNHVLADYAEYLAARALNLTLATAVTKGFDASDEFGRRYQVKARRWVRQRGRLVGGSVPLEERPFDILAGLLLRCNYRIERACCIPMDVLRRIAVRRKDGGWKLRLTDTVWETEGVEDVTAQFRACEAALS